MDTVFKVCDAMENVTLSASTVVPRYFACGTEYDEDETASQDDTVFVPMCGDVSSKFASRNMEYFVDDNSVCLRTCDEESKASVTTRQQRLAREKLRKATRSPLHEDEKLGKESSWASIDGRQPPRFQLSSSKKNAAAAAYSKPVEGFQDVVLVDPPTDEDRTRATCDDTYTTDVSERSSLVDKIEEAGSDFDPINMTVSLEKIGLGLFGLPLEWTHVVKKKSSWNSNNSHKTTSTSSTSSSRSGTTSSTSGNTSKNRRDDLNSVSQAGDSMHDSLGEHYQYLKKTSSSKGSFEFVPNEDFMLRELPSFGKSREFRSFGSHRSLEDQSNSYSLKPTYMTAKESKQLHEGSSRNKYIFQCTSSDRSDASGHSASKLKKGKAELTTTIPYSSLSKKSSPKPSRSSIAPIVAEGQALSPRSKRNSLEKVLRNKLPKLYSS